MEANLKWHDEEDENENFQLEEVRPIHKKLIRKGGNLAKELRDYHKSKTNEKFTNWASTQPDAQAASGFASKMLQSDIFGDPATRPDTAVKKFAQTTLEDSINSVVQSVDVLPGSALVSFGGYDKVLKVLSADGEKPKGYRLLKSLYFEDCPIVSASFTDASKHLLSFLKKPFVNFFDSEKEKSSIFYKLFDEKEWPEGTALNPGRGVAAVWSRNNLSLFDTRHQLKTATKRVSSSAKTATFFSETTLAVAHENETVHIFDLRKSLNIPIKVWDSNCNVFAGNATHIATGNKYGIVELRKNTPDLDLIKRFDQLTTAITSIDLTDSHLLFVSRWKKNAVRIVGLGSNQILPKWPNIKTNLKIVTAARLGTDATALFGTAHGNISAYKILV